MIESNGYKFKESLDEELVSLIEELEVVALPPGGVASVSIHLQSGVIPLEDIRIVFGWHGINVEHCKLSVEGHFVTIINGDKFQQESSQVLNISWPYVRYETKELRPL